VYNFRPALLVKKTISVNHESYEDDPKTGVRAYARTPVFGLIFLNL
jgi:hypothetical protein